MHVSAQEIVLSRWQAFVILPMKKLPDVSISEHTHKNGHVITEPTTIFTQERPKLSTHKRKN